MKIMSRDFTTKEKLLLLFFALVLVALAYYNFVDKPVRAALASAAAEQESLQTELQSVQAQLERMHRMRSELDDVTAGGTASEMGSYNNSKLEIESLNRILGDTLRYNISFSNVTRSNDQIRRNFNLSFTVDNYETLERVVSALTQNQHRCLIGDLNCNSTRNSNVLDGNVSATTTGTFYETMVGGTPDAGLPQDSAAAR